jgi:hypothetical protein
MTNNNCIVCRGPCKAFLCRACARSYDRQVAKDNTTAAIIAWTARRVRSVASRRRG